MSHPFVRPANATPLIGAQELHAEVLDPSTGNVWQSLEPITREEYAALPLEPGWLRVGVGFTDALVALTARNVYVAV